MAGLTRAEAEPDWKQRCRALETWAADLATGNRKRGLVVSQQSGTVQLYAWDAASGDLSQLTHQPQGVESGYIGALGTHVYHLRDVGGGERGHYVRIPWQGGEPEDITPSLPAYEAVYRPAFDASERLFAFAPTESNGFPLYVLDLDAVGSGRRPREIYRSPKLIDDASLSADGVIAAVATSEFSQARQYSLLAFDTARATKIAELSDVPNGSLRISMFSPVAGDARAVCTSDRSGTIRPFTWDIETGERRTLNVTELSGDIEVDDWSPDGGRLLLRQVYWASHRLFIYDLARDTGRPLNHPPGSYFSGRFGPDGGIVTLWTDSTNPVQVVRLDADSGERTAVLVGAGEAPPARRMRSITFTSSDGTEVQGWLGLPEGSGPFPAVLLVHGGPHVYDPDCYNPDYQAWLDYGFAILSINYRGSTTFGRQFKEMIWGDLGRWEVEDMVAARQWLVDEAFASEDEVFVAGGSYGGYLTLMALGKRPDLWAGGVAVVPDADIITSFREGNEWIRGYLTAMMAGTPDDKPEQYEKSSPITYAEDVRAPLLIIAGRNDMRCPPVQIERYVSKMQSLGKPFEIEWFDAGHGSLETDEFMRHQERSMEFVKSVLGRDE